MKKIYTLIAIACLALTANAQHDLKVTLTNYPNGTVVFGEVNSATNFATDAVNTEFTITNDGPAIGAGDTIVYGLILNGTVGGLAQDAQGNVSFQSGLFYVVGDSALPTGGTITSTFGSLNLGFPAGAVSGDQASVCVYASLQDADVFASAGTWDATFNGDATAMNNTACVSYESTGSPVGIAESVKAVADKAFILNNQLVIENSAFDFNSSAIINVINMSGQVVASENMVINRGRNTVELDNLSTGIYVVSIQVEDQLSTAKVLVK